MHKLGLFANTDYSALLLIQKNHPQAHISSVFPGFARFPFMGPDDLQIGATSTSPDARGQGLATRAILEIMDVLGQPGRTFWYLTEAANIASCRAIEKAGFHCVGEGEKHSRLGLRALGYYDFEGRQH
jgi:RimJ/RimL family protein N-acetyltransferase